MSRIRPNAKVAFLRAGKLNGHAGTSRALFGYSKTQNGFEEYQMYGDNFAWLLPVWIIGAPFLAALVEYFRLPKTVNRM